MSDNIATSDAASEMITHFSDAYCVLLVERSLQIKKEEPSNRAETSGSSVVTKVENECKSVKIRDIELLLQESSCGYLGDYYRLKFTCDIIRATENSTSSSTYSFFIKTIPHRIPHLLEMMRSLDILGKENALYQHVFPSLANSPTNWRPFCFDTSHQSMLVLEDLVDAPVLQAFGTTHDNLRRRGYQHMPSCRPFEVAHVRCTLRSLAQMHAASLAYELRTGHGAEQAFGERYGLVESFVRKDCEWFITGLEAIPDICHRLPGFAAKYKTPTFRAHFHYCLQQVFTLAQPSRKHRNVLCHRDLWFRNIMFTFDDARNADDGYDSPQHCVLFDFQHCCFQPPAIDVYQLLYLTTRRSHRRRHQEAHLVWYWQQLMHELHTLSAETAVTAAARLQFSWSRFEESFRLARVFALIFSCVYTPLMYLPADALAAFQRDQAGRGRAEFVVDVMQCSAPYAEIVMEVYAEFVEHVEAQFGGSPAEEAW